MGLLSFSAISEMQKTLKQNKALLQKNRSLKDVSKDYSSPLNNMVVKENRMSLSDFEAFKHQLAIQKRKDKRKRQILIAILVCLGLCILLSIFN